MRNQFTKSPGFTLIETILAITVIGIVITASAQLTESSLMVGRSTLNQFIAYHLAEEGLEITRAVRDSNWLRNQFWRAGLNDGIYFIDEESQIPALKKIASSNKAAERYVQIETGETYAMRVTSVVKYENRGINREVRLIMELTDWKKGPL